jgi:hypothetical protein
MPAKRVKTRTEQWNERGLEQGLEQGGSGASVRASKQR